MKKLLILGLLVCSGCISIDHTVGNEESPYFFQQRIFAFGNAKIQQAAQKFTGQLEMTWPNGESITVILSSASNAHDITTKELQSMINMSRFLINMTKFGSIPL